MQITFQPQVKAGDVSFENLAGNKSLSEKEKVAEACKQFEAVLLRQILKDARKDVMGSGEKSGGISEIYTDMVNNQLADSICRSGTFGLAKSLQTQLSRQVSTADDAVKNNPVPTKKI